MARLRATTALCLLGLLIAEGPRSSTAASTALGLSDEDISQLRKLKGLYEQTVSFKHNIHEIMKPFLTKEFAASLKESANGEDELAEALLEPVDNLEDDGAVTGWLADLKTKMKGNEKSIAKEMNELFEMALEDKFTSDHKMALKKLISGAAKLSDSL